MAKMKTLTVSGQTYTVNDPEAVSFCQQQALTSLQQQTARENIKVCTFAQTADRLCPPFSEADTVVTCRPVEGSALAAVSRIARRQDGVGDPSPDNIRPISGYTAVKLTLSNDTDTQEFTLDLGQTVYGGCLDWSAGLLTITDKGAAMKDLSWIKSSQGFFQAICADGAKGKANGVTIQCSTYKPSDNYNGIYKNTAANEIIMGSSYFANESKACVCDPRFAAAAEFTAYLESSGAFLVYPLAKPVTVQLTPQEIFALSGVNTLYSDTGDTEVKGKADPVAIIEKLTNAILSLGGNV